MSDEEELHQKVEKLTKDFAELKQLAGFMLATLQVNFLRETITTNPLSLRDELQKLLDSWVEHFQRICPPISNHFVDTEALKNTKF